MKLAPEHIERIAAILQLVELSERRSPAQTPGAGIYMVVLRAPEVAALRAVLEAVEHPE